MKIVFLISLMFSFSCLFAQNKASNERIERANSRLVSSVMDTSYFQGFEVESVPHFENGDVTVYHSGKNIHQIIYQFETDGSMQKIVYSYFKGQLNAVTENYFEYAFDEEKQSFDYSKKVNVYELRAYFNGKTLTNHIKNGKGRLDDKSFNLETDLIFEADNLKINALSKIQ